MKFKLGKFSGFANFLVFSALVLAVPLTVFVAQNKTQTQQNAAESQNTLSVSLFGKSLSLDGSSYLTLANSNNLNPQKGFTAEAWIKPNAPAFSAILFAKANSSQTPFMFTIFSNQYINDNYSVTFQLSVGNSGNNCYPYNKTEQKLIAKTDPWFTSWHHVAAEIQSNGALGIFVDGQALTSNTNSVAGTCTATTPFVVGTRQFTDGSSDTKLNGQLDELRISNIARYVTNFTPSTSPFTYDTNTVTLLHFDGNLQDVSGNNYNGVATGTPSYVNSTIGVSATPTLAPTVPPTNTPTPRPTNTPTPTPTNIPTPTPTKKVSPTPTPKIVTSPLRVYALWHAGNRDTTVYNAKVLVTSASGTQLAVGYTDNYGYSPTWNIPANTNVVVYLYPPTSYSSSFCGSKASANTGRYGSSVNLTMRIFSTYTSPCIR